MFTSPNKIFWKRILPLVIFCICLATTLISIQSFAANSVKEKNPTSIFAFSKQANIVETSEIKECLRLEDLSLTERENLPDYTTDESGYVIIDDVMLHRQETGAIVDRSRSRYPSRRWNCCPINPDNPSEFADCD
ncbi:MAG: hypothetical protein F6K16_41375 [Symploca sp. SIO2B6]|nr:hypothetical protein [Symploca sp. SIO2B6]